MCEEKSNVKSISFEDFKKLCEGGVCLRRTLLSKNCLKLYKQQQCFLKYQRKLRKQFELKIDEKWERIKRIVWLRDNGECQLLKKLSEETKHILLSKAVPSLLEEIDFCHYKSRGAYPELKYDSDNIILMNRFSHGLIDINKSPVTTKNINQDEWNYWWEFILGKERKKKLDEYKRRES
jgi:5-methylcytosine-specific restriction endonuclease McrA